MNLITPGEGAAAQYGKALADSEIAIYNGHARRGIGPDFDEDKSPKENFVIGINSALHAAGRAIPTAKVDQSHYVTDKVNDLEEMSKAGKFDKEKYRVWFFGACTSLAYFDELRGGILPESVDRSNLDLLGTTHEMPKVASVAGTITLLDGILASQTIEQIAAAMEKSGNEAIEAVTDPSYHEGREGRAPRLHEEPDRPRGRRRQPGRTFAVGRRERRGGVRDGRRLLILARESYCAGGVIEPNSPWVSSSGPAAK